MTDPRPAEALAGRIVRAEPLEERHRDDLRVAAHDRVPSVSLNQTVGADDEGELGDLFADREARGTA